MIARAFWTTCVVAALCAAGAGADAARVARVHVAGPPTLKVGTSCEAAGSGSVVAGRNKESCLADETTALDTLKQNWSKYQASDKTECVALENSGGPASYVELLSCLEVRRDARTIKNADPLESALDSTSKRRGRRR
jgi:hypothetical protein